MRLIQIALTGLGFVTGPADGLMGPKTRAAFDAFKTQFGLTAPDPADPLVLSVLGLAPTRDAVSANNNACVTVILPARPRPACDPTSTRWTGSQCACRSGFRRVSDTLCEKAESVATGTSSGTGSGTSSGTGTSATPIPLICDPVTTVRSGDGCACRYRNMVKLPGVNACLCRSGRLPTTGVGCG